jgi:hypothetical protein
VRKKTLLLVVVVGCFVKYDEEGANKRKNTYHTVSKVACVVSLSRGGGWYL